MLRTRTIVLPLCLGLFLAAPPASGNSPYAGQEGREIKALSEDEAKALAEGAGMGLAKAAELNGYPGPRHVLDHAEALGLSPAQREATETVFARMRDRAIGLGEGIVARETALDRLFAGGTAEPAEVAALVREIARLNGDLRLAHLRAHLETAEILSPEQTAAYGRLRGYGARPAGHGHGRHD